ncbi:MAG: hypothetical protein KF817_05760 [Phycisphaeraceae bacterium]|nr:hypothetical protein [Phycisphaeraceae bacterium]
MHSPSEPSAATTAGPDAVSAMRVRRVGPWVISIVLHLTLILLGFAVTWGVARLVEERETVVVVADFEALEYRPVTELATEPARDEAVVPVAPPPSAPVALPAAPGAGSAQGIDLPPVEMPGTAADVPPAVAFAGIPATNARRIVFVLDASGSMVRSMSIVIDELRRSLAALGPRQEFAIVFFRRSEAIVVPPQGRLVPATEADKARALAWIERSILPEGRSNPLAALEYALSLRPDVIFLLSEDITGSGEFEIDQRDLLARLDVVNPVDPRTGRRRARINCVQFLDPDPLRTLERIAEAHGDERGYRFLGRVELGLGSR